MSIKTSISCPVTVTVPLPVGRSTGIDEAALDIFWIIWASAGGIATPILLTSRGISANPICKEGSRTEVVDVGAVTVESGNRGGDEEEDRNGELHIE